MTKSKLILIEIASGLTTLMICPQFGLGIGSHNELLHTLSLGGMVLNLEEIRAIARSKSFYFSGRKKKVFWVLALLAVAALVPQSVLAHCDTL